MDCGRYGTVCFTDSDYVVDSDRRRSVSGFNLYVLVMSVSWKPKAEKSVTSSNSESEWVALYMTTSGTNMQISMLKLEQWKSCLLFQLGRIVISYKEVKWRTSHQGHKGNDSWKAKLIIKTWGYLTIKRNSVKDDVS